MANKPRGGPGTNQYGTKPKKLATKEQLAIPHGVFVTDLERAADRRTPKKTLQQLGNSQNIVILEALVQNPNTPASVLAKMSENPQSNLAGLALQHPNIPMGKLIECVHEWTEFYRWAAAQNPKLPINELVYLLDDEEEEVATMAMQQLLNRDDIPDELKVIHGIWSFVV